MTKAAWRAAWVAAALLPAAFLAVFFAWPAANLVVQGFRDDGVWTPSGFAAVFSSARARHCAFPRQNRQWSPGLNSPRPLNASCATGLMLSPHAFSSSTVSVSVLGSSCMRGWSIVMRTRRIMPP